LAVSHLHALRAGSWLVEHRDPFDRMLAAQSELEGMPLITRDPAFALFGVETLW
jgi:PIN domain nuclease of toxin-antitoxin system